MSAQAELEAPPQQRQQHPAAELLGRYRAVFAAAWQARHELAGPKRLADEAAFLPAALSLQETPVHPAPRRIAYVLMTLFVLALTWAIFGQVDIVAVAPGRIVVSERTKLVQPLENSVVRRILVRDGERVKVGQPLVELDPTSASADKAMVEEQLKATMSESLRARTLLKGMHTQVLPPLEISSDWSAAERSAIQAQLSAEWAEIGAKVAKLSAEIKRRQAEAETMRQALNKLETTVPLARKREEDVRQLAEQGFMSGHAGQDRMRERIELERDLATQRARLQETLAGLRESENARTAYLAETRRALHDRGAQADLRRQAAMQEYAKATHRQQLTTLTAPVDGTVQQLVVHTPGGVVTEA